MGIKGKSKNKSVVFVTSVVTINGHVQRSNNQHTIQIHQCITLYVAIAIFSNYYASLL